jgi:ferritin
MLNPKMELELNKQINAEYWSAYFYLSMAAYFDHIGLPGCANWMRIQYQEEISHALKFFDYVVERGGRVTLLPVAEVPNEWDGVINVFEETLKHEQKVTSLINNLMDIAIEERDHAAKSFLQWYVDEQVEEESGVQTIIDQLKMVEGKGNGLFMIDKDLGQRVFVDSTQGVK